MPIEWRRSTWGDEVSLEYGKALRGHDTSAGEVRVYGSNGPIGWTTEPLADGPGVILGRKGAYRGIEFSRDPFFVIDTAYFVLPKTELDMRWVFYAMKHHRLGEIDDGSPIPSTTRAAVYMRDLVVPPMPEQRAIASVLGAFDDKIELSQRFAVTCEQMARSIFKSWFVDFSPVHARADDRADLLPTDLAALFPTQFEDSPIGPVPEGWDVAGLDTLGRFLNGLAMQKFPPTGDGRDIPVIKIAQLRSGHTRRSGQASGDLPPDYVVSDGDVLFSWSGSLECSIWTGGPGALNQHLFKVTSDRYPRWFLYLSIHRHLEGFRRIAAGKATTMGHIKRHHLSEALQAVPPDDLIDAASAYIAPLLDATVQASVEARSLAELRDALLSKLISGSLRLPDVDRVLERIV